MKYIKNLYFDRGLDAEKINEIMVGLDCGEYPPYYYLASFREHKTYLEILSYKSLKVEVRFGNKPVIVGIAKTERAAKKLLFMIVEEQLNRNKRLDKEDLIGGLI